MSRLGVRLDASFSKKNNRLAALATPSTNSKRHSAMRPDSLGAAQGGFDRFLFENGRINIRETFELKPGNFLTDKVLDFLHVRKLLGSHDSKSITDILRAPGAPNSMDVIFGMLGNIVVDHVAHSGNVDASGRDIRGNHHLVAPILESLKGFNALLLSAVGMEHSQGVILGLKLSRDAISPLLCSAKNQDAVVLRPFEQCRQ